MNNPIIYLFPFLFFTLSCKDNNRTTTNIETKFPKENDILINILNDSLINKVDMTTLLDSITKQQNVKIIEELKEEYNEKEQCSYYKGQGFTFKLYVEENIKGKSIFPNSVFVDGNKKFSFNKYKVMRYDNEEFKSEDFGYNNNNTLEACKIIEIGKNTFLYSDMRFDCNGIGCGCVQNFIYDIKLKKPFFIENYRFPYNKFFISDFNNDNIVDLIVVSRGKIKTLKGFDIAQNTFRITWFEYKQGLFKERKFKFQDSPSSLEFVSYSEGSSLNFLETEDINYSLYEDNWK